MEWITGIQRAINYMEEHMLEEIDYEAAAKEACSSTFHFQRVFGILCGFSMETENLVENSRKKLVKKNLDMIAANNLKEQGAGFETDTNIVTLIGKDFQEDLPIMEKEQVASRLLDKILELRKTK